MFFNNPVSISQGDKPDMLLVQLAFSEFEDKQGNKLPGSIIKFVEIPSQMKSEKEVQQVDSAQGAAGGSSKTSIVTNFIVNLLLSGSMSQLWGMINGLQIVAYMPLFKVKVPGNASAFNNAFKEMAEFEVFDTSEATSEMMYFPEDDPLSLSLQQQGIDTTLMIPGMGSIFYILIGYLALFILHFLLFLCAKKIAKVSRVS